MASIPLPALDVKPPQDPTESMNRLLAMQGMMQQQKLQGVQLQQQQLALKDQQTLRDLYIKHSGDLDKVIADAPQAGVSPQTLQALQLHSLDVKKKTADLVSQQGDVAIKQADLMQGAHDAVDQAPAEQKPVVYKNQLAGLQKAGIDTRQMPPEYPGDDQFKIIGATVRGHTKLVEDAFKASETAKNTAQAGEATAQTNKINTETQFSAGPMAEARYRFVLSKLAAKQPVSAEDMSFARGFEASNAKATSSSDTLGVVSSGISRPAGLASVGAGKGAAPVPGATSGGGSVRPTGGGTAAAAPQTAKDSLVDMIGQYKLNPGQMMRLTAKHPDVLAAVNQKYPDWNQPNYNAINHLMTTYTSGPTSREINAVNTALGHVGVLNNAIDALHNSDIGALNKIANFIGVQTGQDPVTTFNTIVHRVGPELAAAYIQGGGGEGERGTAAADFDPSRGPDQLKSNVSITANLLRSKISSLENQYKNTVGRDDFQQRFITPEAQRTLTSVGARTQGLTNQSSSITVKAPNGKTYTFKDQASADAFKQKAGIQ